MSEAQRLALLDMLRAGATTRPDTVEGMRELYEGMGSIIPLPSTTAIEAARLDGVEVEIGRDAAIEPDRHILYFHGGGYTIGSVGSHRGLVALLGRAARARTVSVNYRLAPEHPLPAAFDDGLSVYRALLTDGISANRLVLAGDSAGGAIAAAVLQRACAEALPMPAAFVMFSPLLDITGNAAGYDDKADADVLITRDAVVQSHPLFLGSLAPTDPLVSPVFADLAGFPPTQIQVGTSEVLIDDALSFARAAMLANVDVRLEAWPHQQHVWQLYAAILDEGAASLDRAARFIDEAFSTVHPFKEKSDV